MNVEELDPAARIDGRQVRVSFPKKYKSLQGLFFEVLGPCSHGGQQELAMASWDALPGSGMGLCHSPQRHVTPRSVSKGAEHYRTYTPQLGKAKGCPC